MMALEDFIRDVPDFPKPGIVFKDICPLLQNQAAFQEAIQKMSAAWQEKSIDVICGIESRGFIFGAPLALSLGTSFVPLRKQGKLPRKTIAASFTLEYGEEQLEMHTDALATGDRVLIVDDVLATGGTMDACCQLVEKLGGKIAGLTVLIELTFLHGRDKLRYPLFPVIQY